MKLIIDIPEDKYIALQKGAEMGIALGVEQKAILNGTPLMTIEQAKTFIDKHEACSFGECDVWKECEFCDNYVTNENYAMAKLVMALGKIEKQILKGEQK